MTRKIFFLSLSLLILSVFLYFYLQPTTTGVKEVKIQKHDPEPRVTLTFSGDIMQHMPQITAAKSDDGTFDFSGNFRHIDTVWRSADFAIANFETTISTDGTYSGYPTFSTTPYFSKELFKSGIRYLALANNHSCDKGYAGIRKTILTMDSLGIYHFGLYTDSIASEKIMMLKKNGFRIALLNYTYGINGSNVPKGAYINQIDTIRILKDIKRARAKSATHIIAFIHWGNEYQRKSSSAQRKIGLWLRHNGVDVVIGSHPHVVQEIDTLNRIVYSLGNFISNQKDPYTDSGITVRLTLEKARTPQIEYIPHWCDKFTPTRKQKYRILTERDTLLVLNPKIRAHFRKALNDAREAVGAAKEFKI